MFRDHVKMYLQERSFSRRIAYLLSSIYNIVSAYLTTRYMCQYFYIFLAVQCVAY